MAEKRIAIFPGSFDPFTKGHEEIALRGANLFDELIIGVGHNTNKQRYFPLEITIQKIGMLFEETPNISVKSYQVLTTTFAKDNGARFILRGLRNTIDFEYENSIAQANRKINGDIETVFLMTSPLFGHVSSSIIREMHKFGQDLSVFMPYEVEDAK